MEVPHLMSIRSAKCWLATLNASSAIMSHDVTCLGTIKAARIGVVCQSGSPLLACMVTLLLYIQKIQRSSPFFYFCPGGDIRNTPDCPGHNRHNSLHCAPFLLGMASSLVLFVLRHGVETSNLGDAECCLLIAMFLNFPVKIKHAIWQTFFTWMSFQTWGHLPGCFNACLLPTDTGAVFNSFSKQSCLHTNCSLSSYLCPAVCFQEILFKQARTCHWNKLDFSARESTSLLYQYRQWNSVMYIFGRMPPFWLSLSNSVCGLLQVACVCG